MCKYCEGPGLTCLRCARVCMLEKWREHEERCKMCKGAARAALGDLPRFAFCPYCGRELPDYLPDGDVKPPEKRRAKNKWSDEEVAALIRLRNSRVRIPDCALALGRTEKQIMNKLGDLQRSNRYRAMLGMKPKEQKPKPEPEQERTRKKTNGQDKDN